MLPIQYILCGALILLIFTYIVRLRSYKIDRIIIIFIILAGIIFVLFPDLTMDIAHILGVGRGADLVLYFCVVGFAFCIIILYAKQRRFEELLVSILRKDAIQNAKEPDQKDPLSPTNKTEENNNNV